MPAFISGVLSAVRWHVERISEARIAEILEREEAIDLLNRHRQQLKANKYGHQISEQASKQATPIPNLMQTEHGQDFVQRAIHAIGQKKALQVEMREIQQMETGRTVMALIAITCVIFLILTGATLSGCIFAALSLGLLAAWPYAQPVLATQAVVLWRRLRDGAARSRSVSGEYDDKDTLASQKDA